MTLSIFLCICWPSVCLLWRNVCLGFYSFFGWVIYLFILILSCIFCLYILEINPLLLCLQIVYSILRVVFSSCLCFLYHVKAFNINEAPCVYFCLGGRSKRILLRFMLKSILLSRRWVKKDLAVIYVEEYSA